MSLILKQLEICLLGMSLIMSFIIGPKMSLINMPHFEACTTLLSVILYTLYLPAAYNYPHIIGVKNEPQNEPHCYFLKMSLINEPYFKTIINMFTRNEPHNEPHYCTKNEPH